jgi:thiamine biosynthesis lipoprotein
MNRSMKLVGLAVSALGFCSGCAGLSVQATPVVLKRTQLHMGTLVSITAVAPTEAVAQAAMTAGFQEIKRLEQLLSTWIPASELSRVNTAAGERPVKVSEETFELVTRALEIAKLTDGGFNIAVGPAVEAWSVTERERVPSAAELDRLRPLTDWSQVHVDATGGTIFLPHAGMRIDVGGIGKGYAAD